MTSRHSTPIAMAAGGVFAAFFVAYAAWISSPPARLAHVEAAVRRAIASNDTDAAMKGIGRLRALDPHRAALAEARLLMGDETGAYVAPQAEKLLQFAMRDTEIRPQAQASYASLLLSRGQPDRRDEALAMLQQASRDGSRSARVMLAENLPVGDGNEQSLARLYTRSSRESPIAAQRLEQLYAEGKLRPRSLNEAADLRRRYFELIRANASKGQLGAIYNLGLAYERGYGTNPDQKQAERWFRDAAERGSNRARLRYAAYLRARTNDPKAVAEAHKLLLQAAKSGSVQALVDLAEDFEQGRGVPRDLNAANANYRAAAAKGSVSALAALADGHIKAGGDGVQTGIAMLRDASAQRNPTASFRLYEIYSDGLAGVPPDPVLAAKYLTIAADLGSTPAIEQVALALAHNPQDPEAFRRAALAVERGSRSTRLLMLLGDAYASGHPVTRDPQRAITYYRQAAARGSSQAIRAQAKLYFTLGGPDNSATALLMLQQAAARGVTLAYVDLGRAHASGAGVPISAPTAVKYFAEGARAGDPIGMIELGRSYATGYGVHRDEQQAAIQYRRAADLGSAQAMTLLAYSYEHGLGVPRDLGQARTWLQKATATGDPESAYWHAVFLLNPNNGATNPTEARRYLATASAARFKPAIALMARL